MFIRVVHITVCALAAIVPLLPQSPPAPAVDDDFPGWPTTFEGRPIRSIPLSPREATFAAGLPGQVTRCTDGHRDIVLRWVAKPTRKLHPAADCYRGLGYTVHPRPLFVDEHGQTWGAFQAVRNGQSLDVRERIFDADGQSYSDISSWYWAATLGKTTGPWWAVTIAEEGGQVWSNVSTD